MNYLYHMVPQEMAGKNLMPLNMLKDKHPKSYEAALEKYENRKQLLKAVIPKLNCLWNDVLHFTAVHPGKVNQALKDSGLKEGLSAKKWFKVDSRILDYCNTIIWTYPKKINERFKEEQYIEFNPSNLVKCTEIGEDTKKYYKMMIRKKEKPLLFHLIPHILYRGVIPLNKLEVISIT